MPTLLDENEFGQTIRTDDGQVVTVPRGIVDPGSLPGYGEMAGAGQPVNPAAGVTASPQPTSSINPSDVTGEATPSGATMPPEVIQSVTGFGRGAPGFVDTEAGQPMAPAPVRELAPVTVSGDYSGKGGAKRRAADVAATGAGAGPAGPADAPPQPAGPRDAFEAAMMGEQAAYDDAIEAERAKAAIAAEQSTAQADVLARREETLAGIEAARQKQAEADAAQRAKLEAKYSAAVDAEASWKMDRGRYWNNKGTGQKVGMAIAMALSGLGEALQGRGGRNPALDLIMGFADDDVADQMQEHDNLAKRIGITAAQADRFRAMAGDRAGEFQLRKASALEVAARQVETIAAQYGSPMALASGEALAAKLRAEKAGALAKSAEGAWNRGMQERQLAEQQAARRAASAQAAARLREDARQFDLSREDGVRKAIAQAQAAGDAAKVEALTKANADLSARGIADTATGEILVQPEGRKMLDQAAALEKAGRTDEAAALRGEAYALHGLRGRTPEQAGKLATGMAATQTAIELADEVKGMRAKHGANWTKSSDGEKWMQTKAQLLAMTLKEAYQLGALDKGSLEVLNQITGGDPGAITAGDIPGFGALIGASKGPGANLEAIADSLTGKMQNELRAAGYRGKWSPVRLPTEDPTETADEAALKAAVSSQRSTDPSYWQSLALGGAVGGVKQYVKGATEGVGPEAIRVLDNLRDRAKAGDAGALATLEATVKKGGALGRAAVSRYVEADQRPASTGGAHGYAEVKP